MHYWLVRIGFIAMIFLAVAGYGQSGPHPVRLEHRFSEKVWSPAGTSLHPELLLEGQRILVPDKGDLLEDLALADRHMSPHFNGSACTLTIPAKVTMEHCSFGTYPADSGTAERLSACREDDVDVSYTDDIAIYHSRFDPEVECRSYLHQGAYGRFSWDTLYRFALTSEHQGFLVTASNVWRGELSIDRSDMDVVTLASGVFAPEAGTVSVSNSHLNTFLFIDNTGKEIAINFAYDTLSAAISILNNNRVAAIDRQQEHLQVTFARCLINAPLISGFILPRSKVVFEECTFGPGANLINLGFDTIVFKGCLNIPSPILLSSDTGLSTVALQFVNSNFNNIKFDYRGKYQLYFDSADRLNTDLVSGTYENLLAKFKLEGKNDSYKTVDIEYQQYHDSQNGWLGWLKDTINRAWWYYSYRKYYILYWTVGFLAAFFLWNILLWEKMQRVYPIMKEDKKTSIFFRRPVRPAVSRPWSTIFIFTALIFFSIRIDLGKLSYKNTRLVSIFFIQYVVGLACMFFIVNAILKI